MQRLIEDTDAGLPALMGKQVTCLCANYFYTGKLTGVNDACIELAGPAIVYETGSWDDHKYADIQKLPTDTLLVMTGFIEAIGVLK